MNLRVAKIIKWFFENLLWIITGLWLIHLIVVSGSQTLLIIGGALVIVLVLSLIVWAGVKLYEKAERTIKEVEEGDFEDDV